MAERPNLEVFRIAKGREADIFVGGYLQPLATAFQHDAIMQQDAADIFGYNQQLTYQNLDGSNLSLEFMNDPAMQLMYDICTDQVPYGNSSRSYVPNENVRIDVVRNLWNEDGDGYEAVEFWANWNATINTPTGGPRDRGAIRAAGRARAPIRLWAPMNTKIAGVFDLVPVTMGTAGDPATFDNTATATLTRVPTKLPIIRPLRGFESYAFAVEVQCRDGLAGGKLNFARKVPITANLVDSTGKLTLTETIVKALGLTLDQTVAPAAGNKKIVTHAFVTYLFTPPAGAGEGTQGGSCLLGNGLYGHKGRFED